MLRATLRSLLARKLRLLLSGFAVVLGVAFVSGAFVLTDTLQRSFENLFQDVTKGTALTIQGKSALGGSGDGRDFADAPRVPQSVLDAVRKVPGVAEAIGRVRGYAQVVDLHGKAYSRHGPPTIGIDFDPSSTQESLRLRQGRAPVGPHEAALDLKTSQDAHIPIGSVIKVLLKGPTQTVKIVGIVGLDKAPSFAGATLVAFDPTTAQELLGKPGEWSSISVASAPGVSQAELKQRVDRVVPSKYEILTQKQTVDERTKRLKQGLSVFNTILLVFAGIALFVGMFLIFNTFSMLIAQRTRELALMRALGASRGQVMRSVLVEAVLVGLISSLIGLGGGILVAKGIRGLLNALGLSLPSGATVIAARTIIVSLVVGVVVTVVAALVPARRAARVAPVQAMRESGPAEDRSLGRRTALGALVTLGGAAALASGLNGGGLTVVGLGAALSFIGVATLSPLFARQVVGFVSIPFRALGAPSALGRGNAMRSPRRTSATAAALMIGLALVAMVSAFGESAKQSLSAYVARSLGADFVVHTDTFDGFSPAVATEVRNRPEFQEVAVYLQGPAKVNGQRIELQGVTAKGLKDTLRVATTGGDLGSIDRGQLAVSDKIASARSYKVGQTVTITWSGTGNQQIRIGAIFKQGLFTGGYVVGSTTYDENVIDPQATVIAVTLKPGVTPVQGRLAIHQAVQDYPNVVVEDPGGVVSSDKKQIDSLLNVITGLLVFSVLIAVLGIVNTLALSVVERTREIGMLRAVGLSRRQTRRMIRVESVLISLYGAFLGIAVGLVFGWALVQALHDQGIDQFAIPWVRLFWVLIGAAAGGIVAAALPARRAARLDVLGAIATE